MAALVVTTPPVISMTVPSVGSVPLAVASWISGRSRCDLVTAIVGRMSSVPLAIRSLKMSCGTWPHGSRDTIFDGSNHDSNGPIWTGGSVLVKSGRKPAGAD